MKLHILSAYPPSETNVAASLLREEIIQNESYLPAIFESDPQQADCIIFFEHHPPSDPLFFRVYTHEVYRKFYSKCLLYHDADVAYPLIAGIYPSATRRRRRREWIVSSPYFFQNFPNRYVENGDGRSAETSLLFSFLGNVQTHRSRQRLLLLRTDPRGTVEDTSQMGYMWTRTPEEQDAYHREYAKLLTESKFILCPRGVSPCSYRLTEAMRLGRVPVILSDDWLFPDWIPWREFALIHPERGISDLGRILRSCEQVSAVLGSKARDAWERLMSPGRSRALSVTKLACRLRGARRPKVTSGRALILSIVQASLTRGGRSMAKRSIKTYVQAASYSGG